MQAINKQLRNVNLDVEKTLKSLRVAGTEIIELIETNDGWWKDPLLSQIEDNKNKKNVLIGSISSQIEYLTSRGKLDKTELLEKCKKGLESGNADPKVFEAYRAEAAKLSEGVLFKKGVTQDLVGAACDIVKTESSLNTQLADRQKMMDKSEDPSVREKQSFGHS